jgi:hypothetical protein
MYQSLLLCFNFYTDVLILLLIGFSLVLADLKIIICTNNTMPKIPAMLCYYAKTIPKIALIIPKYATGLPSLL